MKEPIKEKMISRNTSVRDACSRIFRFVHAGWAFFVLVWLWGGWYYGEVLKVARAQSFWVANPMQMEFVLNKSNGWLWYVGRMVLQLYYYPWLGGLTLAVLLGGGSVLINRVLHIPPYFKWIGYIPALAYLFAVSYSGLDVYFETETGTFFGWPCAVFVVFLFLALLQIVFSRQSLYGLFYSSGKAPVGGNFLQLAVCVIGFIVCISFVEQKRPYVRVISKMILHTMSQDWDGAIKTAHQHADQSNRPMAAHYAIALMHKNQQCDRMYDIRLDFDSLYIHGWNGKPKVSNRLFESECNFHAGLVQTAYRNCMEMMVTNGPSIRGLELMTKCALMRNEWRLAGKYLCILKDVPFESHFYRKYVKMLYTPKLINEDPEIAHIRLTEPMHDAFESSFVHPVFLGYNVRLREGRSANAAWNSMAACLYSKMMPDFVTRVVPFRNASLPENVADGILLASNGQPQLVQMFQHMDLRIQRLDGFLKGVSPYLSDRPGNARKLFDRYKGYYPYYYFFGNLHNTIRQDESFQSAINGGEVRQTVN